MDRTVLEGFKQQGFVVLKSFFSKEEAQALLEYIQTSPGRYDYEGLTRGAMTFYSSVFFNSPEIQKFISQQKIIDVLKQMIGPDIWVRWDQAVAKGPGADTFPWHQDNSYNNVLDGHYQFWIALTEMTEQNGALCLQPGSHKSWLPHKKIGNEMVYDGVVENPLKIEAEPGDVVIFSSYLLHSTTPNVTQNPRWAYVIEYMSLDHADPYVEPPYFVVAKDGISCPQFLDSYPGVGKLSNRWKYFMVDHSIKRLIPSWMKRSSKKSQLVGK